MATKISSAKRKEIFERGSHTQRIKYVLDWKNILNIDLFLLKVTSFAIGTLGGQDQLVDTNYFFKSRNQILDLVEDHQFLFDDSNGSFDFFVSYDRSVVDNRDKYYASKYPALHSINCHLLKLFSFDDLSFVKNLGSNFMSKGMIDSENVLFYFKDLNFILSGGGYIFPLEQTTDRIIRSFMEIGGENDELNSGLKAALSLPNVQIHPTGQVDFVPSPQQWLDQYFSDSAYDYSKVGGTKDFFSTMFNTACEYVKYKRSKSKVRNPLGCDSRSFVEQRIQNCFDELDMPVRHI